MDTQKEMTFDPIMFIVKDEAYSIRLPNEKNSNMVTFQLFNCTDEEKLIFDFYIDNPIMNKGFSLAFKYIILEIADDSRRFDSLLENLALIKDAREISMSMIGFESLTFSEVMRICLIHDYQIEGKYKSDKLIVKDDDKIIGAFIKNEQSLFCYNSTNNRLSECIIG